MKTQTTTRKITRARSAFLVMSPPHEELTELIETCSLNRLVSACLTVPCSATDSSPVLTTICRVPPEPTTCGAAAVLAPASSTTRVTSSVDTLAGAADGEAGQADQQQDRRGEVPAAAGADEVERRLAPVEAAEDAGHGQDSLAVRARRAAARAVADGGAAAALPCSAATCATAPSPESRGEENVLLREATETSRRVNRKTMTRSRTVDMPRVNAKPFTAPAARR